MALTNIKRHVQAVRQNNGILKTDQIELTGRTAAPSDSDLADGRIYYNSTASKFYGRANSAWVDLGATSSSSGVSTWDGLYAADQSLSITGTYGTLTFTVTGNNAGLTINKTASGAGAPLVIANSGTGNDVTGPAWSLISTGSVGILELTSGGTINATGGALTIGAAATETTFAGTISVDGGAGSDAITADAGDFLLSEGSITATDDDNAATVSITNDGATTYGASADHGVVEFICDTLTTGTLLHLSVTEGTLNNGYYFRCWDETGDSAVFTIGEDGRVVIGGVTTTEVFTITVGDAAISDGSLAVTDADNAATFTVTNNTATTASVIVLAGSGTFTGTTTSSFMTITPSGLTSGTAVYMPVAALTTGTGLQIVGNALTSGQLLEITSSATAIATTGRMLSVSHSGATGTSAVLAEFSSAAGDETTVLRVTASGALASGVILDVSGAALTTGTCIDVSNLAAITTGKGLHIDATGDTQTDGMLVHVDSASTKLTSTGRLLLVDHTGASTVSGVLSEFKSAGTDETVMVQLTASGALALGRMLKFSCSSVTTGDIINAEAIDALTTGRVLHLESGATAITGNGRLAYFNHTGASSTSGTLVEIASAAADETIMFQLTASAALASGVVAKVTAASLTTGTVFEAHTLDALTTGIGVHVESGATAITGTGRLLMLDHSGATTTSGVLAEVKSAATDETVMLQVQASAALAAGRMLKFIGSSVTTGDVINAEALDALTTGRVLHLESGATAITGNGRLAYFNHTGATTTSGTLVEVATAATDETIALQLTASGALALGKMVMITADSCTTGFGIDMTMDALTTGVGINFHSDSSDSSTRDLVHIHNDNTSATGTTPLQIVQDAPTSTNFKKCLTLGGITIWVSDGTSPNGNLTGTTGDICLAGTSGQTFYASNGAGKVWASMA